MLSRQRFGFRLMTILFSIALSAAFGPNRTHASIFDDAHVLVRSGDIEKIERTFDAQYQDFLAGKITIDEFAVPYGAFETLDPIVLEMIAQWREAMPGSAYARVAEARPKTHLAIQLRGEGRNRTVTRTNFAKAWPLWTEALQLFSEALDIAPRHIVAARGLQVMSQWLGDDQAERRANRILAVDGSPVSLLISVLNKSTPRWGGSVAKMRRICDTVAPKIENISIAECNARATLLLWDQSREIYDEAIEVLRHENKDGNRVIIARELLNSGRAQEALELFDEVDAWVPSNMARAFAVALKNYALQERIVDRWLAISPLTPRDLVLKAEAQFRQGYIQRAVETIEKAMIYGETIPEVRQWRLISMLQDGSRNHELLGEIEDALFYTDLDPSILNVGVTTLLGNDDRARYWSDGSEHSRYQCRRVRILIHGFNSCVNHPELSNSWSCADSSMLEMQQILELADHDACKDLGPLRPVK